MTLALLRRHWPAIALAVLAAGLLALPPFWAKFASSSYLHDPLNIRAADEFYYFARIRDVLDGHPFSANPFTGDAAAGISGQPVFLGEYLTAEAIRLTGLDVVSGSAVLDGILPAFAVLLTYACILCVSARRSLSLLGAALLFFWFFPGDFARTVSPQMNFLFWLTLFLLLHALLTRNLRPRLRWGVLAASAVNLGLLAYLYTYHWTFWLVFLGIMLLAALVLRDGGRIRATLGVLAGGLVITLPYLLMLARTASRPEYLETLRRVGLIDSHFPSGIAIVMPAFLLLAAAWFLVRAGAVRSRPTLGFLAAGAVASIVSVNQHVLTGKNLEFSSHYYMLAVFWFVFLAAHLAAAATAGWGRRLAVPIASAVLALAGYGVWQNVPPQFSAERAQLRRYLPVLGWFGEHARPGEVILAPLELSNLIPIYTSADVFFSPWLRLVVVSDDEVLDRFAIASRGERWEPDAAVRTVFGVQYLDAALHTGQENKVRRLFGLPPKPADSLPASAIRRIEERRAAIERAWPEPLGRYRADFAVLDRRQSKGELLDRLSGTRVYDEGDFVVYRLNQPL